MLDMTQEKPIDLESSLTLNHIRFGAHKSSRPLDEDLDAIRTRSLNMLARCLNMRNTVAVVGSGCSIPLGYVSWRDFTEQLLLRTIKYLGGPNRAETAQFENMLSELNGENDSVNPGSLTYFLGVCKRAILKTDRYSEADKDSRRAFSECFEKLFGGPSELLGHDYEVCEPKKLSGFNPYEMLLRLPIRRFVTTNYDLEIERALEAENRNLSLLSQDDRLLTQEDRHTKALACFALADLLVENEAAAVFHCHGHYGAPESIIAGEADYQRWYLGRRHSVGSVFRQTIELLFESNPLLFVGYGLSDEDLLRPLRTLGAADPKRKTSRPIFAIMSRKSSADDYRLHQYYERYGLHVITYDVDGGDREAAFRGVLSEVCQCWQGAQDEWLQKPPPRKVSVARDTAGGKAPTNWYLDEGIGVPLGRELGDVDELRRLLGLEPEERPSIIGYLGPSGCGKTRKIRRLMGQLRQAGDQFEHGFFYWNGHYVNEGLTGIDQFLEFVDPDQSTSGPRNQRLGKILATKDVLVILDGAERLLQPIGKPLVGAPISSYVRQLLEVLADRNNRATVVLVGRLWPERYHSAAEGGDDTLLHCCFVQASRIRQGDLVRFVGEEGFDELEELVRQDEVAMRERLSALCSLLDGHNYGLLLALEWVSHRLPRKQDGGLSAEWHATFDELRRHLTRERLGSRVWKMIGLTVRDIVKEHGDFVRPFLRQMAFSLSPMSPTSLELILDFQLKESGVAKPDFVKLLEVLKNRHMLVQMPRAHEQVGDDANRMIKTFAVHSKVRSYFYGQEGRPDETLPSLSVAGLSSGGAGVDPIPHEGEVRELIMELIKQSSAYLEDGRRELACDLCRDAYSVLRGRLEANTAARWCGYATYSEIGIHLARLAKAIGQADQWDHRDSPDRASLEKWSGALFLGEVAWLYNDVGLALLGEGLVADAYSVWEQAFEIHCLIEEDDLRGGIYQIQGLINLSYALLELGRISSARDYLRRAQQMNRFQEDEILGARIQGLSGLIQHLNGNLREAKHCYNRALRCLKGSEDLRARSFFHKYRADLHRAQGQIGDAEADIRAARIAADEGGYPDLAIEALMSRGHFEAEEERWAEARLHYEAALRASVRIQSPRLQSAVLCNLARLSLDQKDSGGARYHALRSLKLANEYRLGLRVSHSLVVLGLATIDAGLRELGVAYLQHAKRLASRQQYWYRAREAEMKLQELGED